MLRQSAVAGERPAAAAYTTAAGGTVERTAAKPSDGKPPRRRNDEEAPSEAPKAAAARAPAPMANQSKSETSWMQQRRRAVQRAWLRRGRDRGPMRSPLEDASESDMLRGPIGGKFGAGGLW